jgi:hypothetical protein
MSKVQVTFALTHMDINSVTYSYAYDQNYLASMVISKTMFEMLGRPNYLYAKLEAG